MFKNKAYLKMLLTTTLGAFIILSSMILSAQHSKINQLEDQLYLKQQNEQRACDHYESILNEKTIQSKFNTLQEYQVLKGSTVEMNHKYEYTSDGMFGIKKRIELNGHGKLQYDGCVRLSTAVVTCSNNGRNILVQIEAPYIDLDSVKLVPNTLVMQGSNYSFFSNKEDGAQAQKLFIDSFVDSGTKNIEELYNLKSKQAYLEKAAVSEVHALIRTLNLNGNVNVQVEIIK
jgi:hypothetical protein